MTHDIMDFIEYIHNEKQTSKNTEVSYERDLRKMNEYLEAQNVYGVSAVTETNLNAYVMRTGRTETGDGFKEHCINESFFSFS